MSDLPLPPPPPPPPPTRDELIILFGFDPEGGLDPDCVTDWLAKRDAVQTAAIQSERERMNVVLAESDAIWEKEIRRLEAERAKLPDQVQAAVDEHVAPTAEPVALRRAFSVLTDVLREIEGWEDKALPEAVAASRAELLTLIYAHSPVQPTEPK